MKVFKVTLFWIWSCLWGCPMTLFGAVTALVMLCRGYKPQSFHGLVCFAGAPGGSGFEAGGFFFVGEGTGDALKRHEAGHGVQNLIFGPLMPFLVSIPSAIRFWVRRAKIARGRGAELPPYDSIWFEAQATRFGERFFA